MSAYERFWAGPGGAWAVAVALLLACVVVGVAVTVIGWALWRVAA